MKVDLYTKCVLTVIALALTIIAVTSLVAVRPAFAQSDTDCSGELKANAFGGTTASIGGYSISLNCR